MMGRLVVVDLETTGTDPARDRVVSLAAIEAADGALTGRSLHLVFNPGRRSSAVSARIHGFGEEALAVQPGFADHAEEIAAFLAGALLAGHGVAFDIAFLAAEFARLGRDFTAQSACTRALAKARFPGQASGLSATCRRLGFQPAALGRLHNALVDANLAWVLYQHLALGVEAPSHVPPRRPDNWVRVPRTAGRSH